MAVCLLLASRLAGAVPGFLNYQGRVAVAGVPFDGTGQFKFALVNAAATQVYWGNSPDQNNDLQPDQPVALTVARGLYSVQLGDTAIANMASISASVFTNGGIHLRVWFNDGISGFQALSPTQPVAAVGYALMAAAVEDGAITTAKLEPSLAARIETASQSGLTVVSAQAQDAQLIARGFAPFNAVPAPAWVNGSTTGAPSGRHAHSAIWTGAEFIVWGGLVGTATYSGLGGRYSVATDAWSEVAPVDAPAARSGHSGIWTGTEMVIWGGFSADGYLNTGGRFKPDQGLWNSTSTVQAPSVRDSHNAVWTGSRMLVWGGRDVGSVLGDGALYDPASNQWTSLALAGAPAARCNATAVWTGQKMIVWGGLGTNGALNTGGALTLTGGTTPVAWQATSAAGAPDGRFGHTAVWTGQKMIVWGGQRNNQPLNDGAIYDPSTDAWTAMPQAGAPSARSGHCAVWTGTEMVLFAGETSTGATASGAAFNPGTSEWRTLANGGGPIARIGGTSAWTGSELLVFGGRSGSTPLGTLQRVNPQPAWFFYRKL